MFESTDFSNKFMNRLFRPVKNVVWDLMSGRIGVQTSEGIVTMEGEGEDAQVTVNIIEQFGMPVPAFAQGVPVDSIKLGDFVYGASKPLGWVVKKNEKSFMLMKPDGTKSNWSPPKVQMLGFDSGVMVLKSLMSMLPGGSTGLGQMQGMLMPLLMMGGMGGGKELDLESLMPMMLISQMGVTGPDGTANPAMSNTMPAMMQTILMMKMMGGGNMFGAGSNKESAPGKFFK